MASTEAMADTTTPTNTFLTTSALLIPLSLTAILPNIAPLIWHIRSKNTPTSSCLFWILTLNLINLLNAIIWHTPDTSTWFHGKIFCDVEVRLIVAGGFGGLTGATLALAMSLARVLDVERVKTGGRQWVRDALVCWAPPVWMAVVYYVVQNLRYAIAPAYGCTPESDASWPSVALLFIWPVVFMVITGYYTGLVFYRLHTYRTQVSALLARSSTTRSRFTRLLILALLLSIVILISSLAQMIIFLRLPLTSYSWARVHAEWNYARLLPAGDTWGVHAGRWCWVVFGWMSFLTIGCGEEVQRGYKEGLEKVGLDKVLSSFSSKGSGASGSAATERRSSWFSSIGSKAKLLFNRNSTAEGSFNTLNSPQSSRFSKSSSPKSPPLLPIIEPKPALSSPTTQPKRSKLALFANMPSFGQAFAGVAPTPVDTSRKTASKILITVPSPTIGGLNDELILQMVGAEPMKKKKTMARKDSAGSRGEIEMVDVPLEIEGV